jgi:hypothetical protein
MPAEFSVFSNSDMTEVIRQAGTPSATTLHNQFSFVQQPQWQCEHTQCAAESLQAASAATSANVSCHTSLFILYLQTFMLQTSDIQMPLAQTSSTAALTVS